MWQKIKDGFRNFMVGRHGADQLSLALLIAGLVLSLISRSTHSAILSWAGYVAFIWSLFRIFSRNSAKRYKENDKFVAMSQKAKAETTQFIARLKNLKQYKYFHCPQCRQQLRVPRGKGRLRVTCTRCGNKFEIKS